MYRNTALRRIRDSLSVKLRGSPRSGEVPGLLKRLAPGMGGSSKAEAGGTLPGYTGCAARQRKGNDVIDVDTGLDHSLGPGASSQALGWTHSRGPRIAVRNSESPKRKVYVHPSPIEQARQETGHCESYLHEPPLTRTEGS